MRAYYFIISIAFIILSCESKTNIETETKPNVIFILADDMGYYDLGCYGQEIIQTPNIDQLASDGIRFTQFYSGSPVCAPARSTLMTGQHTGHTTVRGNASNVVDKPYPLNRVPLNDEDYTIAELFKNAGYVTGITGKWGLGEPGTEGVPNKQGFDEWLGYLNQNYAHNYYPEYLWRNQDSLILDGNKGGKEQTYTHHLMTDFALDFIKNNADTSFFLYLAYTVPHDQYEIPDLGIYADREGWSDNEKVYAAMITLLDKDIGKINDLLQANGIENNTIIMFASDNGAAKRWERFNSVGSFRGYKRAMYEGGIRVPFIVKYPGLVEAGSTNNYIGYFPDVMPTVADMLDIEIKSEVDGKSFLPALKSEVSQEEDRLLYWEFHEGGYNRAVRWGNWKGVKIGDNDLELYNLENDIAEEFNIADEYPEVVNSINQYLDTARTKSKYWPVNEDAM